MENEEVREVSSAKEWILEAGENYRYLINMMNKAGDLTETF